MDFLAFLLASLFITAATLVISGVAPTVMGVCAIFHRDWEVKFFGGLILIGGLVWMSAAGPGMFIDSYETIVRMASKL